MEKDLETSESPGVAMESATKGKTSRRVLIVEDDLTYNPLWVHIVRQANKHATIEWTTSAQEAARAIVESNQIGRPFDLIISDIYLEGPKTGIDLWVEFHQQFQEKFVLISSIDQLALLRSIHDIGEPLYIRKPIDLGEAIMVVHGALAQPHNATYT